MIAYSMERFVEGLPISVMHRNRALHLWQAISAALDNKVPLPVAQLSENDSVVHFSWNSEDKRKYADIEVFPNGALHWFYRNRDAKEIDGTDDDPVIGLPPQLVEHLRVMFAA